MPRRQPCHGWSGLRRPRLTAGPLPPMPTHSGYRVSFPAAPPVLANVSRPISHSFAATLGRAGAWLARASLSRSWVPCPLDDGDTPAASSAPQHNRWTTLDRKKVKPGGILPGCRAPVLCGRCVWARGGRQAGPPQSSSAECCGPTPCGATADTAPLLPVSGRRSRGVGQAAQLQVHPRCPQTTSSQELGAGQTWAVCGVQAPSSKSSRCWMGRGTLAGWKGRCPCPRGGVQLAGRRQPSREHGPARVSGWTWLCLASPVQPCGM